jgi:hypothetical protein
VHRRIHQERQQRLMGDGLEARREDVALPADGAGLRLGERGDLPSGRTAPEAAPLAELIAQRYGIEVHRTTVQRALKKNRASRRRSGHNPEQGSADDDPVQAIYERIRTEALAYPTSASWEYERVRH